MLPGSGPPPRHETIDFIDGPPPPWLCEWLSDCDEDYLAFATLAMEHATLRSEEEVWEAARSPGTFSGEFGPGALREAVVDALGIRFLLDGLDERALEVTRVATRESAMSTEEWWVIQDPWVGTFTARLLRPRSSGPRPGRTLLALPGHLETADTYLRDYGVRALTAAGFTVLVVEPRADDSAGTEDRVARTLLVHGFTLLGLRAYEGLLGLRLLRALEGVDPDRIGLLGQSGGSVLAAALLRVEPSFGAVVLDTAAEFWNLADDWAVLCESVPALLPLRDRVNDFRSAEMPVLVVPYAYEDSMPDIARFFLRRLGAPLSERTAGSAE